MPDWLCYEPIMARHWNRLDRGFSDLLIDRFADKRINPSEGKTWRGMRRRLLGRA